MSSRPHEIRSLIFVFIITACCFFAGPVATTHALDWRVRDSVDCALSRIGSHAWDGRGLRFCEDAMITGAGTVPSSFRSAPYAAGVLGAEVNQGGPAPRGSWVFYHWYGRVDGTYADHGLAGISLGDGTMVSAWDGVGVCVRPIRGNGLHYIGRAAPPILPPVPDWVSVHFHEPQVVCPLCRGFTRGGTPAYWRSGYRGFLGPSLYAWCNGDRRDVWARWTFDLAKLQGSGLYRIEAFIPRGYSTTAASRYRMSTTSGIAVRVVDQGPIDDAWVDLGTHELAQGSAWVELDDATGELYANGASPVIGFDCVRLTPVSPGAAAGDAGSGSVAAVVETQGVVLSTPTAPSRIRSGRSFVSRGTVIGQAESSVTVCVRCYRSQHGRWVLRKTVPAAVSIDAGSRVYEAVIRLPSAGRWRVSAAGRDRAGASVSSSHRRLSVK